MVLLRPTTVVAGLSGRPLSRPELSVAGVQLVQRGRVVWAKKMFWLRNPPYTVGPYAHKGQIEIRLKFAQIARSARGCRGIDPETGLPCVAAAIKKQLTGYRAPDRMEPAQYPSRHRRSFYTAEDLERIARQLGLRV